MGRAIIGVIVGLLIAALIIAGCGYGISEGFAVPHYSTFKTPKDIAIYLDTAPQGVLYSLLGTWALASLLASWIGGIVARPHNGAPAIAVASLLTIGIIISIVTIIQPAWFPVVGMLIPFPFAIIGWRFSIPRREL